MKLKLYEMDKVTDLKDMLQNSLEKYSDRTLFLVKDSHNQPYRPITYKQYGSDVHALGTALVARGYKDKRIAVLGENCYGWTVGYMATATGVGIIVPIDKELPGDEIVNMIARAEVSVVIFSDKYFDKIKGISDRCPTVSMFVCMGSKTDEAFNTVSLETLIAEGNQLLAEGNMDYMNAKIDPYEMSILLFTSGTTSDAKAVMLSQHNIVTNLMAMGSMVEVRGGTCLSILPLHHTYECTCGFLYSVYGGCTVAFCEGLRYVQQNMCEAHVTYVLTVPLLVETMYNKIWANIDKTPGLRKKVEAIIKVNNAARKVGIDMSRKLFKQIHSAFGGELELFVVGAAPMNPEVSKGLYDLGIRVRQGYGLTECAPIIALGADTYYKDEAVGYPMPGVQIEIFNPDEDGSGEIIAKGENVMLGYYNNQEATDSVIIDGWFHTGDVGYKDKDGFVYITGRCKNMILTKNGKNVYPEEIEPMILELDTVKECVVFEEKLDDGDARIACMVYPDVDVIKSKYSIEGEPTKEQMEKLIFDEIKENVNGKLVSYKAIRNVIVRETEFVKTTTLKIKRHMINQ